MAAKSVLRELWVKTELEDSRTRLGINEAMKALEKQIPKEIIDDGAFGLCPGCKEEFNSELINEYNISYCHNCGQKLIRD